MITSFRGEYFFLSNFSPAPVTAWGLIFPTAEHAFVACKVRPGPQAQAVRQEIAGLRTPAAAKRFGRSVELRSDWGSVKLCFMHHVVQRKFALPDLRERLVATDPEWLVEGNSWGDRYWGECDGQGANHLGRLLMQVRDEVQVLA